MAATEDRQFDRAMGALVGGALGDALGMPTQLLSADEIRRGYGHVDRFVTPTDDHPVSRGLPAGMITDDTEQTLLLAEQLLASPERFDHAAWVERLLAWEIDVKARGSYDLLGPSTKRAIDLIRSGTPAQEAGREGTTNGAAMRIAPVAIATPVDPLERLVARIEETCAATHATTIAISSAAAVAAAISAAIDGHAWNDAAERGIEAARAARHVGAWSAGPDIAARIEWARGLVSGANEQEAISAIVDLVGTSVASQESIPAAFAVVAAANGDPWRAAVISANLGGDTDTIGAIAGAMAGAATGQSELPADRIAELRGFDLGHAGDLAKGLLALRNAAAPTTEAA
ncbi:ADP-ribosylglycohydrolase family protein [Jiella endophytica]|uniref:ADP-ribosylglycohydrolase family protein n=1 Tax=Jiella endophytica TaxID=2558362 RepID=A0A4Y8RKF8_9HYPH|nr:ADP-ribosylglycohydrolase family protein [Jiella endophytica]TFF23202.1 ADP-ribosylglycohydrolase family protein [Jiella endophytica]